MCGRAVTVVQVVQGGQEEVHSYSEYTDRVRSPTVWCCSPAFACPTHVH